MPTHQPEIFAGRWALVTGASSGLGDAFAHSLAARHTNLILTARSEQKLVALADRLAARHGIQTRVVPADLGATDGARALAAAVDRLDVPVDHLISNAGFGSLTRFAESRLEREAEMVRLNCETLVVLTRHFLPAMLARGRGGVIHVASIAGFQPTPYFSTYGATKAFVLSFSAAIAGEVRGGGVRVLALCPGPVPTNFQSAAGMAVTDIRKHGLRARLSMLTAEQTVERGLAAYQRGRDVYVPGVVNWLVTLATKLAPRSLVVNAAARSAEDRVPASRAPAMAPSPTP